MSTDASRAESEFTPVTTEIHVEVRYAETDQMGVVHHAVYPVWFELARTHLCAKTGFHYADIEKMGYFLMVTGLELEFRRSARYGDTLRVQCAIRRLGSRGLTFGYEIYRSGDHREDKVLASGLTRHVWLRKEDSRPCRMPGELTGPFTELAGKRLRAAPAG